MGTGSLPTAVNKSINFLEFQRWCKFSTSKMSKKKLFSIPSIGEIKQFEQKKAEVKSHFKLGNQDDNEHVAGSSTDLSVLTTSAKATNKDSAVKTVGKRTCDTAVETQLPTVKLRRLESETGSDKAGVSSDSSKPMPSVERIQPVQVATVSNIQPSKSLAAASVASVSAGPSKVPAVVTAAPNSIIVNPRQRGNPIIKHVRNVPWQFGDIVPDYVMGRTVCALYLSLRYHHLNPNYIHDRLKDLGHSYELRVLLVQVDVKDPHHSLKELARMSILADCTLLLAWSAEEAGRYLETYKAYENKPVDALKEKIEQDFLSRTLDKIMAASKEDLSLVPGFGSLKAQRLHNIFHEPFLKSKRTKLQDKEKATP